MALPLSTYHSRLLEFRAVFAAGAKPTASESDRLVRLVDSLIDDINERRAAHAEARDNTMRALAGGAADA